MGGELLFGNAAELIRNTVQPRDIDEVPYIGLEHIEEGTLRLNGYGSSKNVDSAKFLFRERDILFGKLRPYFRKVIRAPFDGVCSTDIWVVRAKNGVDQGYLYYWMAAEDFVEFATSGSEGTRMPRAKWEHVSRFSRPMLDISEQRAIAHILGTLDDKIELNRQTNRTLEAMAQALFKSFFLDFDPVVVNALRAGNPVPEKFAERAAHYHDNPDALRLPEDTLRQFPDRFQDSELGPIPDGWEVSCVANLGDIVCGKTPPTKDPSNYGEEFPFITIPDMHDTVYVTRTMKCLSRKGAETQKNKYIPPNSICVSCIATPGLVVLTSDISQTNQQINTVIPKDLSPYYIFSVLRMLGQQIKAGGSGGSVFANLNKSRFSQLQVLLPKKLAIDAFHSAVEMWFEKILINEKQSQNLTTLRDTLLPKLISGELRVPDAEKLLEDAL